MSSESCLLDPNFLCHTHPLPPIEFCREFNHWEGKSDEKL